MSPASSDNRSEPTGPPARRWHAVAAGLLHALLMGLAFPPIGLWPLALVSVTPLAWIAMRGRETPLRTALWTAVGTVPFWAGSHAWIAGVSPVGYFPLVLYLSFYPGLFTWIAARLLRSPPRRLAVVPTIALLWVGLEVLRGEVVMHGYAWYLVAHPLIAWAPLASPAAWIGAYGVSLLVALVGVSALAILPDWRSSRAQAAWCLGVCVCVWGLASVWGVPRAGERTARIAAVQTNLPQTLRMDWPMDERIQDTRRFLAMTLDAGGATPTPDLIVWPETMYPGFYLDEESLEAVRAAGPQLEGFIDFNDAVLDATLDIQVGIGRPLLIGTSTFEGLRFDGEYWFDHDHRFNSVVLANEGRIQPQQYDKLRLTPFGEEMPYISAWPWLERRLLAIGAEGMPFDLSAGSEHTVFEIDQDGHETPLRIVTPICFESTIAPLCRRLVYGPQGRRADVMITMTNDGWFAWFDGGRAKHKLAGRWRCVELGTPMVRAANTGISSMIDHRGRVLAAGVEGESQATRVEGVLIGDVALPIGETFYGRRGWDVVAWVAGIWVPIAVVLSVRGGRRAPAETTD